jgi:signal transduction histidine kinase
MRIRLLSTDHRIGDICREIVSKFGTQEHQLSVGIGKDLHLLDDLYIWNLQNYPASWHPSSGNASAMHILLVEPGRMADINTPVPGGTLAIILKPVQRDCLEAVVELAIKRYASCAVGSRAKTKRRQRPADDSLAWSLSASPMLQQVGAKQSDFLARILHDLRSPITSMDGYCNLLINGKFGPLSRQQLQILRRMTYSVGRLSRMTTDALGLTTGGRRGKMWTFQVGDLQCCLTHALDEIAPLAMAKGIRISTEMKPPEGILSFDQLEIERVLINLLENACKFTPAGGEVLVKGSSLFWDLRRSEAPQEHRSAERRVASLPRTNAYRIDVVDSGPGIPDHELDVVFEAYFSRSRGWNRAALGLGLATSKMIIDDHEGEIFAVSGESGAEFSFVLPFLPSGLRHKPIAGEVRLPPEQAVV